MIMTKHAEARKRQRGFTSTSTDIILKYGIQKNAPEGATEIYLSRKDHQKITEELKMAMKQLERAKNGHLIVKSGMIITMYK